jgi:diguanylate cyclase (GGDEF)-like protein
MSASQPNRTSIIVIDDDPVSRVQLRLILEKEGYRILLFNNCEAGIAAYTRYRPQLVIQGLFNSCSMNGFECSAQIRQISKGEFVPIIMVLDEYLISQMDQLLTAGAIDYISKPIHSGILLQRVKIWLEYTKLKKQLKFTSKILENNLNIDLLTDINNRKRFDYCLQKEWARMAREQSPISLLISSLDFFDNYYNQYGQQAGDKCLQSIAQGLTKCLRRPGDMVARYDKQEFGLILPKTDKIGTIYIGEKVRTTIKESRIFHGHSPVSNWVTLSMGAASLIPNADTHPQTLVKQAEKSLVEAQKQGYDRLCIADI